ncbi:hypothetical protein OH76DRAFT_866525 [Lentinus brumalis]|uniref:Uncharacterized protein n=1 Tax=Lentinus brumalis TaxID=2498619 RepID=A0A371DRE2_9APHY|nr:hypothetical protein OH76DRAFT_866525 [Polyporus brumalis]
MRMHYSQRTVKASLSSVTAAGPARRSTRCRSSLELYPCRRQLPARRTVTSRCRSRRRRFPTGTTHHGTWVTPTVQTALPT